MAQSPIPNYRLPITNYQLPIPNYQRTTKMTLTVRVIAPDKTVWDAQADEVILPSTTGQLGILSGHAPLLSALDTGVMRVRSKGENWLSIALLGGFAEVDQDEVTILVNSAERGDSINLEQSRVAYNEAQTQLSQVVAGDRQAQIQATQAYKRARARYQAAGGMI
jgi:F-type H+-transporting ATPase subunit epsilon